MVLPAAILPLLFFAVAVGAAGAANAQTSASWSMQNGTDPFSGALVQIYTLPGRWLKPPAQLAATSPPPLWEIKCRSQPHQTGSKYYDGSLVSAVIHFGAGLPSLPSGLPILYRLDGGRPQADVWAPPTAGNLAYLSYAQLATVFYRHDSPHRAGTTPASTKLVVQIDPLRAESPVLEFDIPNPDAAARACGITYHER